MGVVARTKDNKSQAQTPKVQSTSSPNPRGTSRVESSSQSASTFMASLPKELQAPRADGSSLRATGSGKAPQGRPQAASTQAAQSSIEFRATICRGGAKLGLEAETNSDGTQMLVVHHLREGPILEWNRANPD